MRIDGSPAWQRAMAAMVQAALARLAAADSEQFEDEIVACFEDMGALFGVAAMGEVTRDGAGTGWFDADQVTQNEVDSFAAALRPIGGSTGPFSLCLPDGRVAVATPCPPGSFALFTAVLCPDGGGLGDDAARALELLSSVIASARRRNRAEVELRMSLAHQEMASSVAERAGTGEADEDTLVAMLELARDQLGLTAASTLIRDGDRGVLVATTDFLGEFPVPLGTGIDVDTAELMEFTRAGHIVRGFEGLGSGPEALLETAGEVLCVASYSAVGIEGMVVFTDVDGRTWSEAEIQAAKSVARSVQTLTIRAESEREDRHRRRLDQLVSGVASVAAGITIESLDEVVGETLRLAIDSFDIRAAAIWAVQDETAMRIMSIWDDGRIARSPQTFVLGGDTLRSLVERGHGFVRLDSFGDAVEVDDRSSTSLLIPIGAGPVGLLVFSDRDRWWAGEDVAAARSLAALAEQTRVRIHADAVSLSRLRSEEFVSAVAALAVDVVVDNADDRLDDILRLVLDHFGVVEASIWRAEGNSLLCRSAVRGDGAPTAQGTRLPDIDLEQLGDRGWALLRHGAMNGVDLSALEPDIADLFVTGYGGPDGLLGALILTDPARRWWDEDHISAARAVADVLGQLRVRMQVARRLERQMEVDRILSAASGQFVHATADDVSGVVCAVLEPLRRHFGLAAITILELDHRTLQLAAPCEVTDDGMGFLQPSMPIPRDYPSIARLLDPLAPSRWRLADLFTAETITDHRSLITTAVRGRDLILVIASNRDGGEFDVDLEPVVRSLTTLLAQLRRRLLLERHSRRRAEADRLVGAIARSFVEEPAGDDGVLAALARIGEFFELRVISRWDIQSDGSILRAYGWRDPATEHGRLDQLATIEAGHPLVDALRDNEGDAIELGVLAPDSSLSDDTIAIGRLYRDGIVSGGIVALTAKPRHLIVDLDIQRDALEAVARLIDQLTRRQESDEALARQLRNEAQLRRFATDLVMADIGAARDLESAFGELMASASVDQATIWHFRPGDDGVDVNAVLHAVSGDVGELDDAYRGILLPADHRDPERAPHFSAAATMWARDDAPPGIRQMIDSLTPAGSRQIAFLPAPGSDTNGEGSYLILSRPGHEEFRPDELEFFRSGHSVLIQHQARVTAERRFSTAFNSAPVGISLREADMTLILCNQAYSDLVGRPIAELVGTTLFEVVRPDLAETYTGLFDDGYDAMKEFESSFLRPDGSVRWASIRSTPIHVPGQSEPMLLTYAEDITEHRLDREMLEYQATHDELTGLPNRRSLVAEVSAELERSGDCAVLVLDLDRFKVVNDSLGHSIGDQLLITCSDRIRLSLRPGDSVCRLGGDEFAILLRSPADAQAAGVVADRLLGLLREPVMVGDDEIFPSASIGVALPGEGDTVEDLLRHADVAMYQAKGRGRDRWEAFDGSMRRAVVDRIRTESELRRAIENGQLEVHYQPEFLLATGEIVGNEALVRWRHPERGLLTAGEFIGLAEESGLIADLGRWVLSQATMQAASWVASGHDVITRVNLSARQLRGAVVAEVQDALSSAGLAPQRLCLELTETAIMDDVAESTRILDRFRDLGVQVAIDDFGTGFSSLAYLKRFPVDILKIDRTFVAGVGVDHDDTAIVRSVIGLARTLKLEVVAEGIENDTQRNELVRLGCARGQGFHLARPAPADDISRLLASGRLVTPDPAVD